MNLQFHPVLKDVPLMSIEERAALGEDMKQYGQKYEILLLDGLIIDGRNRYLACKTFGLEPRVRHVSNDDPKALYKSMTFFRRHWTTKELAVFAHRMSDHRDKSTENVSNLSDDSMTVPEAAKAMGVSESSVYRARADEKKSKTSREVLREISPRKLIPQMGKAQHKIIKRLKEITDQISKQDYVVWLDYPKSLLNASYALTDQAKRVADLEVKEIPK